MHSYSLIRSKRKTMSLEVGPKGVTVRAPLRLPQGEIDRFVSLHGNWIDKHLKAASQRKQREETRALTPEQIAELKKQADVLIKERVRFFSARMGLVPTGIKITSATKRFGSCNPKNSLCFSWRLMLYPEVALDYVVVHELAHIKHKNHGKAFYALIAGILPDYKQRKVLLKE